MFKKLLRYWWLILLILLPLLVGGAYLGWRFYRNSQIPVPVNTEIGTGWYYHAIDDSRPNSQQGKMGLVFSDINEDSWLDVIAGSFVYFNPQGILEDEWERVELPNNVDIYFAEDVNGNALADLIGANGDKMYWLEAENQAGTAWRSIEIATVPDFRTQGYEVAQIVPDALPELVFTRGKNLFYLEIPEENPEAAWPLTQVASDNEEEDVAVADIDGDGDLDIATQDASGHLAVWYENPSAAGGNWERHEIGTSLEWLDRMQLADINGDGRLDAITSEETQTWDYDANVYWFEAPEDLSQAWEQHIVTTLRSVNSLDTGDMDGDGDIDLILAEHTDQTNRGGASDNLTAWYENVDNGATWIQHSIEIGSHSSHLGARLVDLNQDNHPEVVSIGWDQYRFVHLWIDYSVSAIPSFSEVLIDAENYGDLKGAADLDQDGDLDGIISINGENINQQMLWYENPDWTPHLIATTNEEFTTDFDMGDVDGDGDTDLVIPDGGSGILRWYENPLPDGAIVELWQVHEIGANGEAEEWVKDVSLYDFDGDNLLDILIRTHSHITIWQQTAPDTWQAHAIISGLGGEGMEIGDIDGDGKPDIVVGSHWYRNPENPLSDDWEAYPIFQADSRDNFKFLIFDFNGDGRNDVFVGCSEHPDCILRWYENPENPLTDAWLEHPIAPVEYAHTIHVADMNGDGWLDVITGELQQSADPDRVIVFLNSGDNAHFMPIVVSTLGIHNGVVADMNGDGLPDILGANWGQAPYYLLINEGVE